jgi:hypothetical protein
MLQKLLALVIVLFLPVPALAGTNILKFSCRYTHYVDKEGGHQVKGDFRLTFIIDDKGSAYMLGKRGRIQVEAGGQKGTWMFVEFTPDGHIRTGTEVYDTGYSRHRQNALIDGKWETIRVYGGYCVVASKRQTPE